MPRLKNLLNRAKRIAKDNLPSEVVDAGRKILDEVAERAPSPIADALGHSGTHHGDHDAMARRTEARKDILREAQAKQRARGAAGEGLAPEDAAVVVYYGPGDEPEVARIRATFDGIDAAVREMDLRKEPAQTTTQLAKLTGKMVPPYVYINGKYWGAEYEMVALRADGDLQDIVLNRLDDISENAKRIGGIHDHFDDDITVENILSRWKLGHILCVDDLDTWYEVDKDGKERFFYEGAPHPAAEMRSVAERIAAGVSDESMEAQWLLEPSVHVG